MRTYQQTIEEAQHDWYVVDAAGQRLGTLAVRIARVLMGRTKASWTPHIDAGDFVVVVNAEQVDLAPRKWSQKLYHRHSQYPGGLRTETAAEVRDKHPERLIERAVRGMLPTNRLRDRRMVRLKVYAGANHPHAAQNPGQLA